MSALGVGKMELRQLSVNVTVNIQKIARQDHSDANANTAKRVVDALA